jgi:phospholipase/carboxylesterase
VAKRGRGNRWASLSEENTHAGGRLQARPAVGKAADRPGGLRPLGSGVARGSYRNGYLYVPPTYRPESPAPLVLLLHGVGEDARDGLDLLRGQADAVGLVLLALSSRGPTWDLIVGRRRYGPDIAAIDRALDRTFSSYAVDPARVAVGGYSDRASYALSLGIANGDLFTHAVAFSPGFLAPAGQTGFPRIFVSHGTRDGWLPIERCSRRIVPQLKRDGYDVTYREFGGGHVVPPEIGREATHWFAAG